MHQDKLDISVDLRRELFDVLADFWIKHPNVDREDIFTINSIVMTSLIAHITHLMFKKDTDTERLNDYIDSLCKITKDQLSHTKGMMK